MDVQKTGMLIAEQRKARGMTQGELARRLHVSDRAVSKWERGLNLPSAEQFEPLCEALGITVLELLRGELSPAEEIPVTQAEEAVFAAAELARYKERKARVLRVVGILLACALLVCGGLLVRDWMERAERQAVFDEDNRWPGAVALSHHDMGSVVTIRQPRSVTKYDGTEPYGREVSMAALAINHPVERLDEYLYLDEVPIMVIDDFGGNSYGTCYFDVYGAKTDMEMLVYRWPAAMQGTGVDFNDAEEVPCKEDLYYGQDWTFRTEPGYTYSIVFFWGEDREFFAEYAFRTQSIGYER